MTYTARPTVALLMPGPRRDEVFSAAALDHLRSFATLLVPTGDTAALGAQLPLLLPGVDACLTGWGAPPLTSEHLRPAARVKIIAHAAGTLKGLVPLAAFEAGIVVCHAAAIIGDAVAEATLLLMLTSLRRFHLCDRALRDGRTWAEAGSLYAGHQLAGRTIGLVGCGKVARAVIRLLTPFNTRLLVYDPYLTTERALDLGVIATPLPQLMAQSDIVSNHAPTTPATHHLIGAAELSLLRDDAIFINTARAWTIDEDALLQVLRAGRVWAALDVFSAEPLPQDSPLRSLPNVFLTPHKTGQTVETYERQGAAMIDDLARFFSGQPLLYQVTAADYPIMA